MYSIKTRNSAPVVNNFINQTAVDNQRTVSIKVMISSDKGNCSGTAADDIAYPITV